MPPKKASPTAPPVSRDCVREIESLTDCQKKHPREQEFVCRHLHRMVAYCVIKQSCEKEVRDLQQCLSVHAKRDVQNVFDYSGPIPPSCGGYLEELELCMTGGADEPPG